MADKLPTIDAYVTSERLRTEKYEKSLSPKAIRISLEEVLITLVRCYIRYNSCNSWRHQCRMDFLFGAVIKQLDFFWTVLQSYQKRFVKAGASVDLKTPLWKFPFDESGDA